MIYTVTFNPSLDYLVSVKNFRTGYTNRTDSELLLPGGKGINVSMALENFGIASTALGFVAGFSGTEVEKRLRERNIQTRFIRLDEGFTRINLKLKSIEGTEINGQGPAIPADKLKELMAQTDALGKGDILFLSGSVPPSVPDDIYQQMMQRLEGRGVRVCVDASGDLLKQTLAYRPFFIKPNRQELEELSGRTIAAREDAVLCGKMLHDLGAQNVLISLAQEGAVLIASDGRVFSAPAPKGNAVNAVGAGDAMAAGFLAGWLANHDYKRAFYMGIAAGSASAFSEHLATRAQTEALYRKICADAGSRQSPERVS